MPGYAGSSWYFLRYMDPYNNDTFCDKKISDYWNQVDVYVGGTEHAVGHLLYSRMWTKFLYDKGFIGFDEPFKKLLNQGMITGSSRFVYRINGTNTFVSKGLLDRDGDFENKIIDKLHVDVNIVDGFELDIEAFKKWRNGEYANTEFILEDGSIYSPLSFGEGQGVRSSYICGSEVEKMSKSKFNTVNPDDLVAKYGADTFRMYEMFLGPVEMSKPWDTKGIEGVHRFLKKLWRLYFDEIKGNIITTDAPTTDELKVLHRTIKKIEEDTEKFSYNTAVSAFMIAVNELTDLKCHKREILAPLLILLHPYAPHVSAELFSSLSLHSPGKFGREGRGEVSILDAPFPTFEPKYLVESSKEYPISINGKMRTTMSFSVDAAQNEIEKSVLENEIVQKWLEGKQPKKIIFVKNKMVNVVAP
jgi:leucyl-tRNA synthetase